MPLPLYRPATGTEGIAFMAQWCDRCHRDRDFRDEVGDSCPIVAASMAFGTDDPAYPREWVRGPSGPCCTTFEPEVDAGVVQDARQVELAI